VVTLNDVRFFKGFFTHLPTSDAPELSWARLSSDSARAGGLPAWLSLARAFFEPAWIVKMQQTRAEVFN